MLEERYVPGVVVFKSIVGMVKLYCLLFVCHVHVVWKCIFNELASLEQQEMKCEHE